MEAPTREDAYYYLGTSYRHLYPETPRATERDRLIAKGLIFPIENRPTLRMTADDRVRAAQHTELYWNARREYELGWGEDPCEQPWKQDRRVML